jgi:hypothetical protein
MHFHRVRLQTRFILAGIAVVALLVFFLPDDGTIRLAFRFNHHRLNIQLHTLLDDDSWLYHLPPFDIDINKDVGLILKTGYGTRHRIPAALAALEKGFGSEEIVLIADFSPKDGTKYSYNGNDIQIHDVLVFTLQDERLTQKKSRKRVEAYLNMTNAIVEGNTQVAERIGGSLGWELDAMKVCSSL